MDLSYHQPEDFAADESFVRYCLQQDQRDCLFWEQWLNAHPEKQQAVETAREMVFLMGVRVSPETRKAQWEKMRISGDAAESTPEDGSFPVRGRGKKILAAACVAICLLAAGLLWSSRRQSPMKPSVASSAKSYHTGARQRHQILLPDGTRVWLNADSRLTCDSDFAHGPERVATLSGEAYFDVAADPDRPFIIHARELDIRVLGTAFNVKAYPEDHSAEAALIRGSIQVSLHEHPSRKLILRPHEKITVFNGPGQQMELNHIAGSVKRSRPSADTVTGFTVAPLQTDPLLDSGTVETAWMEGKLVFRDETFGELAVQMEHRYGVHFHFAEDKLRDYRFTGIFAMETAEQALTALQLTTPSDPFAFKVKGNQVFISRDLKNKTEIKDVP